MYMYTTFYSIDNVHLVSSTEISEPTGSRVDKSNDRGSTASIQANLAVKQPRPRNKFKYETRPANAPIRRPFQRPLVKQDTRFGHIISAVEIKPFMFRKVKIT